MITNLIDEYFCTADIAPTDAVLLYFAVMYYASTFKYVSVKITKALVPTPVTDLFVTSVEIYKDRDLEGKLTSKIRFLFHISAVIFNLVDVMRTGAEVRWVDIVGRTFFS